MLKPCTIPSLNLTVKSTYSSITKPRESAFKITEKQIEAVTPTIPNAWYKSYEEFVKRVLNLKLSSEWNIQQNNNIVYVTKLDAQHMVPLYEIFIWQSLRFQIRVLAWILPAIHDMYGQYKSSCENVFLSNLVYSLNSYNVCLEIQGNLSIDYSLLVKHSIPKVFIPFQENKPPLHESIFYQSNECSILTKTSVCIGCGQKQKKLLQRNNKSIKRKANSLTILLKPKAPISLTSPERIKVIIQSYRI